MSTCPAQIGTYYSQKSFTAERAEHAERRVDDLRARGIDDARVYDPRESSVGGTHAIFIFRGEPEEYNLPSSPEVPTVHLQAGWTSAAAAAGLMFAAVAAAFFTRRSSAD